jgi:hypothetical protein
MWRRDGRELYFVTNDAKFYAVDVRPGASFEFSAPRLLFEMPANTISVRNSYVPGKDGQRFLVNKVLDTNRPADQRRHELERDDAPLVRCRPQASNGSSRNGFPPVPRSARKWRSSVHSSCNVL